MFMATALICGLQHFEKRDEEGCFLFENRLEFEQQETCDKFLRNQGLYSLGVLLIQGGEDNFEVVELRCVNTTEQGA